MKEPKPKDIRRHSVALSMCVWDLMKKETKDLEKQDASMTIHCALTAVLAIFLHERIKPDQRESCIQSIFEMVNDAIKGSDKK